MRVRHFRTADAFRRWLAKHHDSAPEIWVGFYRAASGRTGMSYKEAVDQALCYGWIDGVRKRVDDISYTNRFTRRTAKSNWSAINIRRMGELMQLGIVAAPGRAAFEGRDPKRSGRYSFENRPTAFAPELERTFKAHAAAWAFWNAQPPGYRRTITWWVMSAVREETRRSRLATLIAEAAAGRRVALMAPKSSGGRSAAAGRKRSRA